MVRRKQSNSKVVLRHFGAQGMILRQCEEKKKVLRAFTKSQVRRQCAPPER